MAKGKGEVAGWITRNGVHVPIYGNYTVRGGEEPKAKGSKFKGAGKKRKKVDTSKTSGKTANDLNSNLKKKGLELDSADLSSMAHKDFNDEKVTMYDEDGNTYEGTYNKYKNGDREIVDIKKTGGRDTGKSEVSKGHTEEGKGAVKDVEGKKPEMYDWKQDRTDTQEERDAFAKEHEQGIKDRLAKIDEQNKPKAKEETFKGSVLKKSDEKGEGYDWKKDRSDELDSDEIFEARERAYAKDEAAKKEGFSDAEDKELFEAREKAYETRGLRGQAEKESSTPTSDRKSYESMGRYMERKSDEATTRNEMASDKSRASSMSSTDFEMGKKYSNMGPDAAKKMFDEAPIGTKIRMDGHQSGDYKGEYTKTEKGWVGSQDYGSSYAKPRDVNTAQGLSMALTGNDVRVVGNAAGDRLYSDTKEYRAAHAALYKQRREAMKNFDMSRVRDIDKQIGELNGDRVVSGKQTGSTQMLKEGAGKEAKGSIPTTVSGLRSAYSEATGSEKAAIASELRKKGYSLIGGKWVKGK